MITIDLSHWEAERIIQALEAQMRMCDRYVEKSREVEIRRKEYESVRDRMAEALLNE